MFFGGVYEHRVWEEPMEPPGLGWRSSRLGGGRVELDPYGLELSPAGNLMLDGDHPDVVVAPPGAVGVVAAVVPDALVWAGRWGEIAVGEILDESREGHSPQAIQDLDEDTIMSAIRNGMKSVPKQDNRIIGLARGPVAVTIPRDNFEAGHYLFCP